MWKIIHGYPTSYLPTPQCSTIYPTFFFFNPEADEIFPSSVLLLPTWRCWKHINFNTTSMHWDFPLAAVNSLMFLDQKVLIPLLTFRYVVCGEKKKAIKINSISHLKELHVLPPLPGVFSININIFPPSVISHASSSQNPFTGPKLLSSWLTKILLDSKAFSLSRTPTALKGMCLKALTVRLSQSQPPLSDRMHCAMKMMNGVWRCYRVLSLTARRWELYWVFIFLQRGNKTRWFSPVSEVTLYISGMLKAIAVGSSFPVPIPSSLRCKPLTSRGHCLVSFWWLLVCHGVMVLYVEEERTISCRLLFKGKREARLNTMD